MMQKCHDVIVHILCLPLYAYYLLMHLIDQVLNVNSNLKDWLYLKRIRMTQKEFDQFMDWKIKHAREEKLPGRVE